MASALLYDESEQDFYSPGPLSKEQSARKRTASMRSCNYSAVQSSASFSLSPRPLLDHAEEASEVSSSGHDIYREAKKKGRERENEHAETQTLKNQEPAYRSRTRPSQPSNESPSVAPSRPNAPPSGLGGGATQT